MATAAKTTTAAKKAAPAAKSAPAKETPTASGSYKEAAAKTAAATSGQEADGKPGKPGPAGQEADGTPGKGEQRPEGAQISAADQPTKVEQPSASDAKDQEKAYRDAAALHNIDMGNEDKRYLAGVQNPVQRDTGVTWAGQSAEDAAEEARQSRVPVVRGDDQP